MLNSDKYYPILLLAAGGILLTVGDIILKKWVVNSSWNLYLAGLFVWLIALNALAYSFKFQNIAVASMLIVIFNVATLAVVSAYYFGEPLSNKQLFGLLLGLASVALLETN